MCPVMPSVHTWGNKSDTTLDIEGFLFTILFITIIAILCDFQVFDWIKSWLINIYLPSDSHTLLGKIIFHEVLQ